jgi:hemerythrin
MFGLGTVAPGVEAGVGGAAPPQPQPNNTRSAGKDALTPRCLVGRRTVTLRASTRPSNKEDSRRGRRRGRWTSYMVSGRRVAGRPRVHRFLDARTPEYHGPASGPVRAPSSDTARSCPRQEKSARPAGAATCGPQMRRPGARVLGADSRKREWCNVKELRWSDALLVGVPSIDAGHRVLAALVDAIERAVSRGEDARDVQDLLSRLVEDTRDHFEVEGELMRDTGFLARDAHEREHDALLTHVSTLLSNHASGQPRMSVDLARSLRDWLMRHVQERDIPLAEHLRSSAGRLTQTSRG